MPTVLELYEKLKPKLGEDETRALLEFVETSAQDKAATKDDLERTASSLRDELRDELHGTEAVLRKEIQQVEAVLRKEIQQVEAALRKEIQQVEATLRKEIQEVKVEIQEVKVEIQEVKVDLLKWSFAFWLGAVAILSGIMLALLRAFAGK